MATDCKGKSSSLGQSFYFFHDAKASPCASRSTSYMMQIRDLVPVVLLLTWCKGETLCQSFYFLQDAITGLFLTRDRLGIWTFSSPMTDWNQGGCKGKDAFARETQFTAWYACIYKVKYISTVLDGKRISVCNHQPFYSHATPTPVLSFFIVIMVKWLCRFLPF